MEIIIDCGGCADKKELHARIADALSFPDWHGHNLDALMDCLTDLEDTHVTLIGWQEVDFPAELLEKIPEAKREALVEILSQDPRPGYQRENGRRYGIAFAGFDVRFTVNDGVLTVCEITAGQ